MSTENNKKILIIDDSLTQLSSLSILFTREGFEVITASDGVEGYLTIYEEAPDLVVSDVVMPNLNGFQLCRLLKHNEHTQKIPVVLLTMLDRKLDKFWGDQSGADYFISKNANYQDLLGVIQQLTASNQISDEYKNKLKSIKIEEKSLISQINSILDESLMQATVSNRFRELTDMTLLDDEFVARVFQIVSSIIDYDVAALYFAGQDNNQNSDLFVHCQNIELSKSAQNQLENHFIDAVKLNSLEFLSCKSVKTEAKQAKTQQIESISQLPSSYKIIFYSEKAFLGALIFYNTKPANWDSVKFLDIIQAEMKTVMQVKYLHGETEYLSITDELTRLYNRRQFNIILENEFHRSKRYKNPMCIALIDIDDFKKINDSFGHLYGDYVLKQICDMIMAMMRKTDSVYRYGGEEIAIIMPETRINQAMIPLERVKNLIASYKFEFQDISTNITVSIGAAANRPEFENFQVLISHADSALYQAKDEGKNRVILYEDE